MSILQFIMGIMMLQAGTDAFSVLLRMFGCYSLMDLRVTAAIPYVLPHLPRTAISAIFKGRELAIPIPAVFSATAFVMVLVVGVFEFIMRVVMSFSIR